MQTRTVRLVGIQALGALEGSPVPFWLVRDLAKCMIVEKDPNHVVRADCCMTMFGKESSRDTGFDRPLDGSTRYTLWIVVETACAVVMYINTDQ